MFRKFAILFSLALLLAPVFAAEEPTMHEIYVAAEAGRMIEAQSMMDKVLHEHPNSAKAHFVQAELLAKQGRNRSAEAELHTAERLAPGLPFVKPQALQSLRAALAAPAAPAALAPGRAVQVSRAAPEPGLPWGALLTGAAAIALLVWGVRAFTRRNAVASGAMPYAAGYAAAAPGAVQPYAGAPMAAPGAAAPGAGIGSGIMGGLATGAALGAGMVAGQALMRHFTDGDRAAPDATAPAAANWAPARNDMGGNDFGIDDAASWDDGGSAAGGDWD